uniref:MATH domain-containing protein n=1 Tax=Globodera rostochiensis TaxID=31243 RepID=A0A914H875_GLORO
MVEPRHRSPASVIAGTPQPGDDIDIPDIHILFILQQSNTRTHIENIHNEAVKCECPLNIGGDQANDNKYKCRGQIVFRMPKFKQFSEGRGPKGVLSAPVVYINGLPWRINVRHCDAHVGLYLQCNNAIETDMAGICRAAFQFSIVSCKENAKCQGDLDDFGN